MKTEIRNLALSLIVCFAASCNQPQGNKSGEESETTAETEETTQTTEGYETLENSIAYQQGGKIHFYNVTTQKTKDFTEETEEVFNLVYAPEEQALFYTVVKQENLWLKKAVFANGAAQIEELIDLEIKKETAISTTYDDNALLHYRNGKLMMKSNFVWDFYDFIDYTIYEIKTNKLTKTDNNNKAEQLFGRIVPEKHTHFEVRGGKLFYKAGEQKINLVDNQKFEEDAEFGGFRDVEYMKESVSPDGTKVTFVALISFGDMAHGPLCIANTDGSGQLKLLEDGATPDLTTAWLGNQFVFTKREEKNTNKEEEMGMEKVLYITQEADNHSKMIVRNIEAFTVIP